ncbi:MAG: hypothetical protein ACLP0J_06440 [Solirubrobacteraceae bacterium]|jgi:hypothetical protein
MNNPDDFRDDLGPEATDDLMLLAQRLRDARPVPAPAFRGRLGRQLAARPPRFAPARLRMLIATYSASGIVLLALGAVGASGHGPFA